jgi:hypothetical protein
MKRHGQTITEFAANKQAMLEEVIKPNVAGAIAISHQLLDQFGDAVVSPAIFEARSLGWGQDEYMAMWLRTINDKITRIAMLKGWAYSNGACEELCEAFLMQAGYRTRTNIVAVREDGQPISVSEAVSELLEAISTLERGGFVPRVPAEVLHRLMYAQSEGRVEIDGLLSIYANDLLYERADLLSEVDPRFVSSCATSKVRALREGKPADLHLLRTRESLPDSVDFTTISKDSGAPTS